MAVAVCRSGTRQGIVKVLERCLDGELLVFCRLHHPLVEFSLQVLLVYEQLASPLASFIGREIEVVRG